MALNRWQRAGMTLIEAIISLGLISLLLSVVVSLISGYSNAMRKANEVAFNYQPMQQALEAISEDLRAAVSYKLLPSEITIVRMEPRDTVVLPLTIPIPPPKIPPAVHPHPLASRRTVRYFVLKDALRRQTTYRDGTKDDLLVVEEIKAIAFASLSTNLVSLKVSAENASKSPTVVLTLSTEVSLHQPVQVVP